RWSQCISQRSFSFAGVARPGASTQIEEPFAPSCRKKRKHLCRYRFKEQFRSANHDHELTIIFMNSKPCCIAQFGCGYWGPNLLRNFSALKDCHVKYCVDASAERRSFVESNFPRTKAVDAVDVVLA